jgi:multidrug efflux pump subunit AcrA (membrane-fusion protein)
LQCQLRIPQENACDIIVGQKAIISFNNMSFDGYVREKDYILSDDGFLNTIIAINSNNTIIVNASVTVDVILLQKEDVLIIPSDALIINQNIYYVDVLNENNLIERKEIAIGIYGDEFVEIKSGLMEGEKVLLNQYE